MIKQILVIVINLFVVIHFVSAETIKKFHIISTTNVSGEVDPCG